MIEGKSRMWHLALDQRQRPKYARVHCHFSNHSRLISFGSASVAFHRISVKASQLILDFLDDFLHKTRFTMHDRIEVAFSQ